MSRLTNQVLVVDGVALILGEVVEEDLQVGVEGELPRSIRGNKAEHLHRAVGPAVQVPVVTSKVYGCDFAADGVNTSDACEPA